MGNSLSVLLYTGQKLITVVQQAYLTSMRSGEATNGEDALALAAEHQPEILDLAL